jgi:hypothetical protein
LSTAGGASGIDAVRDVLLAGAAVFGGESVAGSFLARVPLDAVAAVAADRVPGAVFAVAFFVVAFFAVDVFAVDVFAVDVFGVTDLAGAGFAGAFLAETCPCRRHAAGSLASSSDAAAISSSGSGAGRGEQLAPFSPRNDCAADTPAIAPFAVATWISWIPGVRSPAAYTPGTLVSQLSSTITHPSPVVAHPSCSAIPDAG